MDEQFLQDLRCPQYVDFLAGIDSNSEDTFFDCSDYQSPLIEKPVKNLPVPKKGLTEEAENKLMNKMTAALSFIESTPKLKMGVVKGEKLFTEKASFKNIGLQQVKPVAKASTVHVPFRMRSKTVCSSNKINTEKPRKAKDYKPKRSSSLNDLQIIRKHTCPKTPLCLRRTIDAKAKAKAVKTTEEMELEQISELQKQLTKMLRQNEISYKKLNLKQRPCLPKNAEAKPETFKGNTLMNFDKNTRRDLKTMNQAAIKKLDSIVRGTSNKGALNKVAKNIPTDILEKSKNPSVSSIPTDILEKSKNPSVSSSIISEESEKNKVPVPKKSAKYGFHSGLVFNASFKKNTTLKPFSFDSRMKEMKLRNAGAYQDSEISSTSSSLKHDMSCGKENIPVFKPIFDVKKLLNVQNGKTEMRLLSSKKTVGGRNQNPVRGLPLAENNSRY